MLTLNMDVPEPWLVEPVKADYDLDNLRLQVPKLLCGSMLEVRLRSVSHAEGQDSSEVEVGDVSVKAGCIRSLKTS